jgi:hypothetical protein
MVKTPQTGKPIDFSIMPSFVCNLQCWFCMYDCGPHNKIELNYNKTVEFLKQIDWSLINMCGFYGGEPSINIPMYEKFIKLIPDNLPRFVITNGTWSTDVIKRTNFINWCIYNKLWIIISSTSEHIKYQNRTWLEAFAKEMNKAVNNFIVLKEPDEIHAQGRAKNYPNVVNFCKFACQRPDRNIRLGLKPDGDIVYQNCHGEYHIVQTYEDKFDGILIYHQIYLHKFVLYDGIQHLAFVVKLVK